jgi:hypothetical protein
MPQNRDIAIKIYPPSPNPTALTIPPGKLCLLRISFASACIGTAPQHRCPVLLAVRTGATAQIMVGLLEYIFPVLYS